MSTDDLKQVVNFAGELAFEHGLEENNPPIVWRVTSIRTHGTRTATFSEWYADEAESWKRVKWLLNEDQEVLCVAKYVLERQG